MKRFLSLTLLALFLVGVMGINAQAEDSIDKLGRGSVNVLTGWLEIPKTVYEDSVDKNPLFGGTFGIVHGAANAIYRTAAGIADIATAPFPPYDQYIIPEYVF